MQYLAGAGCQPITCKNGDMVTLTQHHWGSGVAAELLVRHYDTMYTSTFGAVEVGLPGSAGFSMIFSSTTRVEDYLPASGAPAALNADLVDPLSSASGVFGGETFALRINIDFADAGYIAGTSGLRFGDLMVCNVTNGPSGVTVRQFLDVANTTLGGGSTPYDIAGLDLITFEINNAFSAGKPTAFAQQHLFDGACPN